MRRLPTGGEIDRARPLRFTWDGRELTGYHGDTLASALLGAGIGVIGSSVSLGRPRGIMSAGAEEAHGFAQVGGAGASEPLVRMTSVDLYDGLVAESRITRGRLGVDAEPSRFDKRYDFCDLLVVGGGPAGLAAALAGIGEGRRVMVVERDQTLGGSLRVDPVTVLSHESAEWLERDIATLRSAAETTILTSTTAVSLLDGNGIVAIERLGWTRPHATRRGAVEQRLHHIRARHIVLATGAHERPIVFQDNDRPGIMLATAARKYLRRHALVPDVGLVFTTNDDGYRTALAWREAGVTVAGVVDPRPNPNGALPREARAAGIRVIAGAMVEGTTGDRDGRLEAARIVGPGGRETIRCDLLAVSGGFDPALDLHHQLRGSTRWDDRRHCVVPVEPHPDQVIVGAAAGAFSLGDCLTGAAAMTARLLGIAIGTKPPALEEPDELPAELWRVPAPDGDESRSFVDSHRDATVAGIDRAAGAGIRHVEHLKRYTLIGTGVEQGRAAKINAGAVAAAAFGRPTADVGTSSARPPVEPILFRTLAGRAAGPRFEPVRTTPLHDAHLALGAVPERVGGQWVRIRGYPKPGESRDDTTLREARAVRERVGVCDVSTLGKIDVQGPDAATFLERLYTNPMASLPVGKARYGLLCRLDGIIFDDGVVMRVAPDRFFVTTSTGHAEAVHLWMEDWRQSEWPDLQVWVTPITEQWATIAIAGPKARDVMTALAPDTDWSNAAVPFLAVRRATVAGIPDAQVARVSFSGELAFEVSVPSPLGEALWNATLAAGRPFGIEPYGLDALLVLRAEKGYLIVGQESDSSTTPADAGLAWMIGKKDFVGKRALQRPDMIRPGRPELVGFHPVDPTVLVPDGAVIVADPSGPRPLTALGHVTATHRGAALPGTFGLAMVKGGSKRHGETLHAVAGSQVIPVTISGPIMYDPEGKKRDG